jgi:hypothetical protein
VSATKDCFVIAPIGEVDSETRKRSDQVLRHVIRPAVEPLGFIAMRADEIAEPGLITSQVIQRILDDPLVIADLTERNPNVFYELALRHAIRKPLVQLIAKGERIPFDVAGMRTIPVDHRDLDSVEQAKLEITKQVQALERDGAMVESPISVAIELQSLRQSDKPEQRTLADVLATIADLRTTVASIESRLSSPQKLVPLGYLITALRAASQEGHSLSSEIVSRSPSATTSEFRKEVLRYLAELQNEAAHQLKHQEAGEGASEA